MPDGKSIAERLAEEHREISVAEFFERNKHLLGFENLQKSLLTCVREAVDNSLDSCEDARVLPNIYVEVKTEGKDRYRIIVEDNGPGIVKRNIPKIFAKLLFGGKFNLKQSRGQQGIGISASVLYAQLTTGRPAKIYSRTGDGKTHILELKIDTAKNKPEIVSEQTVFGDGRGTRVELSIKGKYVRGKQSVEEYLVETAVMNPYAKIVFVDPEGKQTEFPRAIEKLPKKAKEIKPHPSGTELGTLMKMLSVTKSRNLTGFLTTEFSRMGRGTAVDICNKAGINPRINPHTLLREEAERLLAGMDEAKLQKPPTDCLSPVGEKALEKGLRKEMNPEFVAVISRHPSVYRGYPFQIEIGVGYGGDLDPEGPVKLMRFANKVPLLYEQGACAMTKAVASTSWKRYGLSQSGGQLPLGPVAVAIHMASVWVPYTSEGKEAVAAYPDIIKEVKLALQDVGRKLGLYLSRKRRAGEAEEKKQTLMKYAGEVAHAIHAVTGDDEQKIRKQLIRLAEERWNAEAELVPAESGEAEKEREETRELMKEVRKIEEAEEEEVMD